MTYTALLHCGVACVLLIGCGGGGDGARNPVLPGPARPDPTVPQTTTGLRGAATDMLGDWAPGGVANYTGLSVIPTTGTASYAGFLFGDLSDGSDAVMGSIIGQLTLDVDFAADTDGFTGAATDFVDILDDPLEGALTITGGDLNRNGNPASDATLRGIAVAGVLRDADNIAYDFGIQLEGDFLGVTAQAIGGEAIGRVRVDGATQDFDGGFIVAE